MTFNEYDYFEMRVCNDYEMNIMVIMRRIMDEHHHVYENEYDDYEHKNYDDDGKSSKSVVDIFVFPHSSSLTAGKFPPLLV